MSRRHSLCNYLPRSVPWSVSNRLESYPRMLGVRVTWLTCALHTSHLTNVWATYQSYCDSILGSITYDSDIRSIFILILLKNTTIVKYFHNSDLTRVFFILDVPVTKLVIIRGRISNFRSLMKISPGNPIASIVSSDRLYGCSPNPSAIPMIIPNSVKTRSLLVRTHDQLPFPHRCATRCILPGFSRSQSWTCPSLFILVFSSSIFWTLRRFKRPNLLCMSAGYLRMAVKKLSCRHKNRSITDKSCLA